MDVLALREDKRMNNISKQDFAIILKQELQIRKPSWDIRIKDIPKTNDVVLTALIIMSDKTNISPAIYLEAFYEVYRAGYSLKTIVREIERLYEEYNLEDAFFDMEHFLDYTRIQKRLCFKVVNAEKNRKMLEHVPHRRLLDLAVVYYVLLPNEALLNRPAAILVNNKMSELWDISESDLYNIAFENNKHFFRNVVRSLEEVIIETVYKEQDGLSTMSIQNMSNDEKRMYYVSTHTKQYGATLFLYNDLLENFAQEHGDFYILPSSIHELLFVPCSCGELNKSELCAMVQEINRECLEEEFLSDNIYLFHSDTKTIEMIESHGMKLEAETVEYY